MWDVLVEAESRVYNFQESWLGLFESERFMKWPFYGEWGAATSADPNSDFAEARAFLRVHVAGASEAQDVAQRAIRDAFAEVAPRESDHGSVRFTVAVLVAQDPFDEAVERMSQLWEEW
jgi:hypothetical protein